MFAVNPNRKRGGYAGKASRALALAVLMTVAARPVLPDDANHSAENIRGVYVYSLNLVVDGLPTSPDSAQLIESLQTPGVDGITLVENWNAIEPMKGVYEWQLVPPGQGQFDQWLASIVAAGKKINLAIRAGADEPSWLFDPPSQGGAGADCLTFKASPHQGESRDTCRRVNIAAPWDSIFLDHWDAMLAAVAQHLKDVGAYESVKLVRLTGINRTTDEFRLPEEVLSAPCVTNSIDTWLAAGYRPRLFQQAWNAITTSFQRSFPDKTFNVAIIPIDTGNSQNPFPEIDDQGCVFADFVPPNDPNIACVNPAARSVQDARLNQVLTDLLTIASGKFPGHLVIEFENLETDRPASPTVVEDALTLHTLAAFQTNDYFAASTTTGGAACAGGFSDPVACNDATAYLALLEIGIYPCRTNGALCEPSGLQSAFIEVFPPDVASFPYAILQAHIELHRSPNAQAVRAVARTAAFTVKQHSKAGNASRQ
jgi:hypothetical protein